MNLKEWAAATGTSYATAPRRYESGTLAVPAYQLGQLIVERPSPNRARNAMCSLMHLAAITDPAGSGPVAGRGADQKTRQVGQVAAKRQPGTAFAGQTGTVPPQGGTTNRALARAC